jgi:hypothetical protein
MKRANGLERNSILPSLLFLPACSQVGPSLAVQNKVVITLLLQMMAASTMLTRTRILIPQEATIITRTSIPIKGTQIIIISNQITPTSYEPPGTFEP